MLQEWEEEQEDALPCGMHATHTQLNMNGAPARRAMLR